MAFLKSPDEILTVSEFSRRLKLAVKMQIPEMWVSGEISNLKLSGSGHCYFTLKDDGGALGVVAFRSAMSRLGFRPATGMKILAYGEIGIYESRSEYQMILKAAMPDGRGNLAARFEELKRRLTNEGLFNRDRKREIPRLPKRIAVITSPEGAAVRDFISVLTRRGWKGDVRILPSRVQGDAAFTEIVKQIDFANSYRFPDGHGFELIVLARGGGSLEDLWNFNEESVARAVADSKIPTISAIGHETDFSLCDFSADLRAETPTAAAEYISSFAIDLSNRSRDAFVAINRIVEGRISELFARLDRDLQIFRLNSPEGKIRNYRISLDEMSTRVEAAIAKRLAELGKCLASAEFRVESASPFRTIESLRARIDAAEKQLSLLGVDNVLSRGFSLAEDMRGRPITLASDFTGGQNFKLRFSDGRIRAVADLFPQDNSDNMAVDIACFPKCFTPK